MAYELQVNPNHYKTAGRERPGQDIVQEIHKQKYTQAQLHVTACTCSYRYFAYSALFLNPAAHLAELFEAFADEVFGGEF